MASGLRPPSKLGLPVPSTKPNQLVEMSESQSNARAATISSSLPQVSGIKHKVNGLPEPSAKQRKIVEPSRSANVRQPQSNLGRSMAPMASRTNLSSSMMPRMPASRSNTATSFSSSQSGYNRPESGQGSFRSQSAMGHLRTKSHGSGLTQANSMKNKQQFGATQPSGTSNGRHIPSISTSTQDSSVNIHKRPSRAATFANIKNNSRCDAKPWSQRAVSEYTASQQKREFKASTPAAHLLPNNSRDFSLSTAFQKLSLDRQEQGKSATHAEGCLQEIQPDPPDIISSTAAYKYAFPFPVTPKSHSKIPQLTPKHTTSIMTQKMVKKPSQTVSSRKSRQVSPKKSPQKKHPFLNKDSNLTAAEWGENGIASRLGVMEGLYEQMKSQMEGTSFERSSLKEMVEMLRTRIHELETIRDQLTASNAVLKHEIELQKSQLSTATIANEESRHRLEIELEDVQRKSQREFEEFLDQHRKEIDRIRRDAEDGEAHVQRQAKDEMDDLLRNHRIELEDLERQLTAELEEERALRSGEVRELMAQRDVQLQNVAADIGKKEREAESIKTDLNQKMAELEREKALRTNLESKLSEVSANGIALESTNRAMKAKIDFLESDNQQQSQSFADLHKRMQEAIEAATVANDKLRAEETLRRKLHNQVQELKGNIRVFCRVRPMLEDESDEAAKIKYPDQGDESKEVVVMGQEQKSSLGNITTAQHSFSFDRVFDTSSANAEVFEEIRQLVQSALDGYNVCIFCYGQTGSGKTFTMSSADGMIPRAVHQIYDSAKNLEEKGWSYHMEGSFVEVYNENLNDLLGRAEEFDKKKHEIRHDTQKLKTAITDVTILPLNSPEAVEEVLNRADRNRSVAATKANQRSSRSHSVFILNLVGENSITGERSEGTLNLVDLAGSERLAHSQAEGQRLRETQSINKSLSCLGDVIGALGKGDGGHVPYRNSKLTYLLQYSLGGNSKTLMFVMISPLQAHLSETLTSLKFATKVHNTHIGTAKRQNKVKE